MALKPGPFSEEKYTGIFFPASLPGKKIKKIVEEWTGEQRLKWRISFRENETEGIADRRESLFKTFSDWLSDDEISMIIAGRGGYGSNYLLPLIPQISSRKPKIIIGSSDLTYLLLALNKSMNWVTFYAPMPFTENFRLFTKRRIVYYFSASRVLRYCGKLLAGGDCEGVLKGGCLSNIVSLAGTGYEPDLKDAILFLEDLNEPAYRLERMLWQLTCQPFFAGVKAILFGRMRNCFRSRKEKVAFFARTAAMLSPREITLGYDFGFGHLQSWYLLPIGCRGEVKTIGDVMTLRIEEPYLQ